MVPPWYMMVYTKLDRVVQRRGWCLALHGSMARDLDVVLIPWTEDAEPQEQVLISIQKFIMGSLYKYNSKLPVATKRPHGRMSYAFPIGVAGYVLDVSTMPIV